MEEIISLLNELKQINQLIIPIFIFVVVIYFLIAIRFVFWFMDMHKASELETYKRLKAKFEKDGDNDGR